MGQSVRGRLDEILHGSIVARIMRETRNIDVVIVAERNRAESGGAEVNRAEAGA